MAKSAHIPHFLLNICVITAKICCHIFPSRLTAIGHRVLPEILEAVGDQFRIPHSVLDVAVARYR